VLLPRRPRRGLGRLAAPARAVAVVLLAAACTAVWYFHRPQPGPTKEALFQGISYERDVRTAPRPTVAHVVTIDLRAPSISFLVTPADTSRGLDVRAQTTSQFLLRHQAQVAINGDFFLPWWSNGPHDYYPNAGDPVYALGAGVSGGEAYGRHIVPYSALVIGKNRAVSIVEITDPAAPLPAAEYAVSGKQIIVRDGAVTAAVNGTEQSKLRHPRTAAALDRSGNTLLLFAVDGRQPGYSEGVTLQDLAGIVLDHGGYLALNLDGGGSTALVVEDEDGSARELNCPIHTRIPWCERPVANHLGVFASRLP
jgi:hypothetical protein